MRLHLNWGLQQVICGCLKLKIFAYRERVRSSTDLFCMPLNFNILIIHLMIETSASRWAERHQNNHLQKRLRFHVRVLKLLLSYDGDAYSSQYYIIADISEIWFNCTWFHFISFYFISFHVMSCHVISCHVI
jgi:hypothetical protein